MARSARKSQKVNSRSIMNTSNSSCSRQNPILRSGSFGQWLQRSRRGRALLRFTAGLFCFNLILGTSARGAVFSWIGGERVWTTSTSWLPAGVTFPNALNDRVFINNGSGGSTQAIYLNSASPITIGALDMANYAIYQGTGSGGLIFNSSLGDAELDTTNATGRAYIGAAITINDRVLSTVNNNMILGGPIKIGGTIESLQTLEKRGNGLQQILGSLVTRSDGEVRVAQGSGTLTLMNSASTLGGTGSSGVFVNTGTMNFAGHGLRTTATSVTPTASAWCSTRFSPPRSTTLPPRAMSA